MNTFSVCITNKTTGETKVAQCSTTTFGKFLQGEGYTPQFGFVYRIEAKLGGQEKFISVQPGDKIPVLVTDITMESCPKC